MVATCLYVFQRLLEVLPRYLHMKIEPCEEEDETPKERRKSSLGIMLKAEEYVLKKPRSELMFERQRERHGLSRDSRGHRGDEEGEPKGKKGQWRWRIGKDRAERQPFCAEADLFGLTQNTFQYNLQYELGTSRGVNI